MNDKPAKIEMVTLKLLCAELKIDPREARERLRLAVRHAKRNPELAKSHKSGHAWERSSPQRGTRGVERLDPQASALQIPNLEGAGSNPAGVTSRTFYCERSLTFR
jgi:hypothetical protein